MGNIVTYTTTPSTGALKDKPDRRDYRLAGVHAPVELPFSFRLNDPFPLKNQDGIGSCTAQSTSYHKQLQENFELSPRYLFQVIKNKIEKNKNYGAYTRNAFQALVDYGICELGFCPEVYDSLDEYLNDKGNSETMEKNAASHKSKSYWRIDADFESIRQAIYQNKQAVVISIPWYPSYNYAPNGYLDIPDYKKGTDAGHAIAVFGWLDNNWLIIKNSWGDGWGLNGMCYFHRDYPIWDVWCSLDIDQELPVKLRYGQPRNYPMEKVTAFNPWLIKKIKRLPSNIEINALWYGKHNFDTVFKGVNGNVWLNETKPQLLKRGFNYK